MPPSTHTILQITDLHFLPQKGDQMYGIDTENYFHQVLNHALQSTKRIDLILVTGDLTQIPNALSYQRIFDELNQTDIPTICLPGNHDDWKLMKNTLNAENISCKKQINLGNWQIICLNSQKPGVAGGRLTESELQFLEKTLQNNKQKPTLVAVHHNCLPTGSTWLDTMTIENSEALLAILKKNPQIKLLIHGHTHQNQKFKADHLQILSAPSTCFQFKPASHDFAIDDTDPGYRLIKLSEDHTFSSEVIRVAPH